MVLQLISATPSPYARKVRIQLMEKDIPYELKTEVPWDHTTETKNYNPVEKLPVLIFDDGREPIYESHYIVEYIEEKFEPKLSLTPSSVDDKLRAKQIEALADAVCDAVVLSFFENGRGEKKSDEWLARQTRKVEGGVKSLADMVGKRQGDYMIGNELSIADLAVVSLVDFMRLNRHPVLKQYEGLGAYTDKLNERKSFQETKPYMFEIKDKIV